MARSCFRSARRHGGRQDRRWVDLHWPSAAAMLEAGLMDEEDDWIPGKDLVQGFEAYRDRIKSQPRGMGGA
ncbi:hypothetical protein IVB18_35870 [Bradyrhizobium sp. 186]|nr:hypothetical protein IVB18_35870 [Bradyrhizobium sp. 186]